MNKQEIEAYKIGYLDGLDLKYNAKTKIFGFEASEVLNILEQHLRNEIKMPTKTKMTRKEAIELIQKYMMLGDLHASKTMHASKTIDFYIEAGMLEIVEELHPVDKFAKLALIYTKEDKYLEFMSEMDRSGLKIVQK